jgi:GAF domain-containing protein
MDADGKKIALVTADAQTVASQTGDVAPHAEIELLYRLADSASQAFDLASVFELSLDAVCSALGVRRASILLFDSAGIMRFAQWRGLSDSYRRSVEGHSPWQTDQRAPSPIYIEDAERDPRVAEYRALFESEGIRALAFIPLIYGERLLGKFMVYADTQREFTERDDRLARAIARHVAIEVGRRLSEEREREYMRRLELAAEQMAHLQSIAAAFSSAVTVKDVAEALVRRPLAVFDGVASVVYVFEDNRDQLVLQAHHGVPSDIAAIRELPLDSGLPLARAIREGTPIFRSSFEEIIALDPVVASYTMPSDQLQAIAALPLRVGDKTIGGVAYSFAAARAFDEAERRAWMLVADQAAQAIERARLYDRESTARREAQVAVERYDALNRVSRLIVAVQLDLDRLVQVITDEATALAGAAFGAPDTV